MHGVRNSVFDLHTHHPYPGIINLLFIKIKINGTVGLAIFHIDLNLINTINIHDHDFARPGLGEIEYLEGRMILNLLIFSDLTQ